MAIAHMQYRRNRRLQRRKDVPSLCGAGVQEGEGVDRGVWCIPIEKRMIGAVEGSVRCVSVFCCAEEGCRRGDV